MMSKQVAERKSIANAYLFAVKAYQDGYKNLNLVMMNNVLFFGSVKSVY